MNGDSRRLWEHALTVALKGGHALRQRLGLDEQNFRFRAAYSHENSRNVYIYRAIDEVQKAATCLMRWFEFSPDGPTEPRNTDVERHMMRITEQAVFDEQALRCRKLTESLVDTILFLRTNEDIYFKDYFYLSELVEEQDAQKDRQEFYGFTSRNSGDSIEWLRKCILRLETSGLDISRRWYLRQRKSIASIKEVSLSSFRSRYKKMAAEQGPEVITLLAKSYLHAYGESRDIHFCAGDTSYRFKDDSLADRTTRVALLMVHLMLRLQDLSLMEFSASEDPLYEVRASLDDTATYKELTTPRAQVGDYVLAAGDLGQVIEERRSKYGYFSYHLRYISRPPIPNIGDDWFASFEVNRLGSKDELLKTVRSILSKYSGEDIPDNATASIDDAHFEQYMRDVFRRLKEIERQPSQ